MALTTAKGTAYWPYIFKPDTKWNEDGDYKIKFRLKGEDAVSLQKKIDGFLNDSVEQAKQKLEGKKIKKADPPYEEVLDDNDNPTGELEFKFKQRAVINTKNGTMQKRVKVVDAKGSPITNELKVGNGSTVKVAYDPNLYYTPTAGAGVSLRLVGVQIIDLVEYANDESNVFGEEEGFQYNNNNNDGSTHAPSEEEFFPEAEDNEEDF